ncbi:MAG: phenylalanine--tRNA ligase subunit beta, partial [Nocardioides sp.]
FRTERRHKLPSEASKRFERGTDATIPLVAADRVADLLTTHGGGTVEDGVTYVGTPPSIPAITIDAELPARVSGMDIAASVTVANLRAVGCSVFEDGATLTVTPPPWRGDVTDPFDLVEEVARIVGYADVPSVLPPAAHGRGLTRAQRLRRRVGRTLAGEGYVEVVSFPFIGARDLDALGLSADDIRRTVLRLANPLSSEEPAMTTTLLPGLLKAAARNVGRGTSDLALFETATVTLPRATGPAPIFGVSSRPTDAQLDELDKALPDQPLHLGLLVSGERERPGWWGTGRTGSWADAVDAVRRTAESVGVEVTVRATARAPWHPGRCAEISVGDAVLGHAGELHPRVCTAYGVPARTAVAEIDLTRLLEHAAGLLTAPEFSSFPVAKEDVALVVDHAVSAGDVEAALRAGAGEYLESIRLFDVYTGTQVGEGKKSLAFALRFRAPDRTLTEEEAGVARDAAVAAAADRCGAVQR